MKKQELKKHDTIANNSLIQIYINKIKNSVVFKIKLGYKLELLSKETMKLLGRTKRDVDQNKNNENVPKLEIVDVILLNCNIFNNNYQQASKSLSTLVADN